MMIIDTYPFINGKAVVWVKDSVFTEDNSPVVAKCGLINNHCCPLKFSVVRFAYPQCHLIGIAGVCFVW